MIILQVVNLYTNLILNPKQICVFKNITEIFVFSQQTYISKLICPSQLKKKTSIKLYIILQVAKLYAN